MISKISSCPENQDQNDTKDIPMVRKVFGRAMIMMLPIMSKNCADYLQRVT